MVLFGFMAAIVFACVQAKGDFTFGEPVNLGPSVNTSQSWSGEPSISADDLELYFTSQRPGGQGAGDIWVTKRLTKDTPWGEPENLGPIVNSSDIERGPSVTADGLELYFSSRRTGRWELYMSTRQTKDDAWNAIVPLPNHVSVSYGLEGPCISPDGLELYFATGDTTGFYELYVARRGTADDPWNPSERLGPNVNHAGNENSPFISCDGLALFFWSGHRLWMSTRTTTTEPWNPRVDLSSKGFDYSGWNFAPSITFDGSTFYFESDRPGSFGDADIWQAQNYLT